MGLVKYRIKQGAEFKPFDYRPPMAHGEITDSIVEWYTRENPEGAAQVFEGIEDLLQIQEIEKATETPKPKKSGNKGSGEKATETPKPKGDEKEGLINQQTE